MKLHFNEIRHSLLDVKKDSRTDVYNWGADNAYPSTMEYLLSASVTAKNAVDKASKAIIGKGIANGHIIINKKGHTINDVIRTFGREYVKHNNAFLSIGYNLLGEVVSIEVIPSKKVRLGKKDDTGYNGKFIVYDNWDKKEGKIDPDAFQVVDRYNPNKEIVLSQIEAAGGISKYKGQIVHIQKYMNEIYSLSDADCVILDMIAEINASEFKQKGSTDGFLNCKIMAVKPFNSDEERNAFKRDLDALRGAKNANSVILLESPDANDELSNQMLLQDLTSSHNDELFKYTEESIEKNIAKAFNVPLALINPNDNGLFSASGEMYNAVKNILWEEKEEERQKIEEMLTSILSNYKTPFEGRVDIIRNIEKTPTTNE
jgi:hypothetical protein